MTCESAAGTPSDRDLDRRRAARARRRASRRARALAARSCAPTPPSATSSSCGATTHVDIWVISWMSGHDTGFHDHDVSCGAVAVVEGEIVEERLVLGGGPRRRRHRAGEVFDFDASHVHRMRQDEDRAAVSIHAYSPPLWRMGSLRGRRRRHPVPARRSPTPRSCGRSRPPRSRDARAPPPRSAGSTARLGPLDQRAERVEHLAVGRLVLGHARQQLDLDPLEHVRGEASRAPAGGAGARSRARSAQSAKTDSSRPRQPPIAARQPAASSSSARPGGPQLPQHAHVAGADVLVEEVARRAPLLGQRAGAA